MKAPSGWIRVLLKIVCFETAYVIGLILIHPRLGDIVFLFTVLPIILAALLWGLWGGLIAAIINFPLNQWLLHTAQATVFNTGTNILRSAIYILIGVVIGRLHDLEVSIGKLAADLRKEKEAINAEVAEKTKELSAERARLIASLSGLSVGVVIFDIANKITFKNDATDTILGLQSRDTSLGDIIKHFETKIDLVVPIEESISRMISITVDDLPFGNKFLRIFISPIALLKDKEAVVGSVMLIEDITPQKILERSKDEFIAIAAHEMRTPLTIIRGNAELLDELLKSSPASVTDMHDMASSITANSVRLLNIVNDFLDVVRLEGGQVRNKKEKFNIAEPIIGLIADLKNTAEEKKLYLVFEQPPRPLEVFADKDHTRQVIANLVGNAIHYTKKGGIKVETRQEGKFIKIFISDTGIGIEPSQQPLLFQKFQTVDKSFVHSREYSSGLGLYIAKLLTESMEGKVALEASAVGKGSIFSVSLPVAVSG